MQNFGSHMPRAKVAGVSEQEISLITWKGLMKRVNMCVQYDCVFAFAVGAQSPCATDTWVKS
jgi:hypothetical protein